MPILPKLWKATELPKRQNQIPTDYLYEGTAIEDTSDITKNNGSTVQCTSYKRWTTMPYRESGSD